MANDYDVLIAGGGMVGASLAVALQRLPLRVALVEAVRPDSDAQPSFDDRTIALSHGSHRVLTSLGLWEALASAAWPIRQIHISEQGRFGTAVIDAAEQGIADLGYVVAARDIGRVLWQAIDGAGRVDVHCPATLGAARVTDDGVRVSLEAGGERHELSTRMLAVVDGPRSRLRSAVGIGARTRAYEQSAIVGNVKIDSRHAGNTAYERFTAEGPLAMLPGPDGRYTFVLTRTATAAPAVMEMSDAQLLDLLQRTFGFRLGRLRGVGTRRAYPLYLVAAAEVIAERCAVIGSAAHNLHPVAGQGFNLGVRDVATLAEILADDPGGAGDSAMLERYRDWRARDQRNVVAFTDGLIRMFDVDAPGVGVARGMGLLGFDLLPAAKRALAHQTMGLGGRLTRLARGLRL